jgi:glycerol kinase
MVFIQRNCYPFILSAFTRNNMPHYLLAIDQGTTNSRAILFNASGEPQSQYEMPLTQSFPQPGWVEQDANEMFNNIVRCCREAVKIANVSLEDIAAVGISNQRETTIVWDRITGDPIYPAIVWQDRRTADLCEQIASWPISEFFQEKTGLLLDPYFSLTKVLWILEHVTGAQERAKKGELLFGTVDTFLLWKLTSGKSHATDASNASRTLMFNIHHQRWDEDILSAFDIPTNLLPIVLDNATHFGDMDVKILGKLIPIMGMAGDQQAATIGQACFYPGMIHATYGTGAFLLLNIGPAFFQSQNRLLTTVLYRLNNQVTYGLEGSIFSAGTTIKWLRDTLHLIQTASETEKLAQALLSNEGVYLVPAFTGLGAPYWAPHTRAAIFGLTRSSGRESLARAALESVAYQTFDLLQAMIQEKKLPLKDLRVDGGMAANNWLMQFLADMLQIDVYRPPSVETTALGAAYLAGLGVGMYSSLEDISQHWQTNAIFNPHMSMVERDNLYHGWNAAVKKILSK